MTSINQISIDLKFTGLNEIDKAAKVSRNLEGEIKRLAQQERNGALSSDQFTKSVDALASKLQRATKGNIAARNQVKKYANSVRESIAATEQAKLAKEKAAIAAKKEAERIKELERQARRMAKAARDTAIAKAAEETQRQREIQSYNQLRASIDKSYAARMRLRQAAKTLRAAEQQGLITREQAIAQLRQYRALQQTTSVTTSGMSKANHIASRQTNAYGMAMQQAGYQVGDFIVQVQSGTNAFVAFGQQATQLVGILPMMAGQFGLNVTRLIAISSVLGVVIPLATALGAAFMRTRREAEDTTPPLEALVQSVEDYSRAADEAAKSSKDLTEMYGESADRAKELFEVNKTLAELDAIDSLKRSMVALKDEFGDFSSVSTQSLKTAMQTFDQLGDRAITGVGLTDRQFRQAINAVEIYRNTVSDLEKNLGSTREEAFQFSIELSKLSQADGPREAAAQLDVVRSLYFQIIGGTENATKAQREMLRQLVNTAIEALNLKVEIENTEKASIDVLKALERITGVDLDEGFMDAANAVSTMNTRLDSTLSKIGGILSAIGSIGFETVAIEAETRALKAGKTEAQARIEGQLAQRGAELSNVPEWARDMALTAERFALEERLAATTEREAALNDPRRTTRPQMRPMGLGVTDTGGADTGGASSATKTQEDYLAKLRQEAELKLRMIGLSEQEQRRLEIETELKQKGLSVEDKRIEQVLRAEQALRRAQEAEKRRENIMNTVSSNIETALMGLVEGTKSVEDAFRGMLRNIILEIYKQQVAQPFAEQAGSFITSLFSANGNVFNNGSHVQAYANGGVVGGPTYFPMSGGKTGLMGEAGPEAIMPLKRTKGGKLGVVAEGASGDVTVVQNFNISANGDDSVKRIIRAEVPRIAEQTKAAVVDAKQRGGSYGRAFR